MSNFFKNGDGEENSKNDSNSFPEIIYLDSFFPDNFRCINILKKYLFYEYGIKNNFLTEENVVQFIKENNKKINDFTPMVKINFIINNFRCPNKITHVIVVYFYWHMQNYFYMIQIIYFTISKIKNLIENWFNYKFTKEKRKSIQKLIDDMVKLNKKQDSSGNDIDNIVNEYVQERNKILTLCYNINKSENNI